MDDNKSMSNNEMLRDAYDETQDAFRVITVGEPEGVGLPAATVSALDLQENNLGSRREKEYYAGVTPDNPGGDPNLKSVTYYGADGIGILRKVFIYNILNQVIRELTVPVPVI